MEGYVEVVNSTVFCERIVYFGNKRLTSCPVLLQMFEEQKQREREKKIKKTIDAGKEESGSLDTSGT